MDSPSKPANPDYLSEYKSGEAFVSSLNEIQSQLKSIEDSLSSSLCDYHQNFLPVVGQISQLAAELRCIQIRIDQINGGLHTKASHLIFTLSPLHQFLVILCRKFSLF